MDQTFYEDVVRGLSATPKYLLSKYFYDAVGDELFQQIMACEEYYLTNCEMEIFKERTSELEAALTTEFQEFDILELGAGDASKSFYLLSRLKQSGFDFTYFPIDISSHIISLLETDLPGKLNGLKVYGLNGDFFSMIKKSYEVSAKRKIVLFLGSSIGNFTKQQAEQFLNTVKENLKPGDRMLVGIDLKKDPYQILAAYNDKKGITRAFNLNLLTRINRELNADFQLQNFMHYPTYDPVSGACRSYLISTNRQQVRLGDRVFTFEKYEPIHMELSQKYDLNDIKSLGQSAGFKVISHIHDSKEWFADIVFERL